MAKKIGCYRHCLFDLWFKISDPFLIHDPIGQKLCRSFTQPGCRLKITRISLNTKECANSCLNKCSHIYISFRVLDYCMPCPIPNPFLLYTGLNMERHPLQLPHTPDRIQKPIFQEKSCYTKLCNPYKPFP